MNNYVFKEGTKVRKLEEAFAPDEKGVSKYVSIKDLETKVGFSLVGNGSAHLQGDRGLGRKYKLDKIRFQNKILFVRLTGFVDNLPNKYVPLNVRAALYGKRCVFTGTSHNIVIDHKDGTYPGIDVHDENAYQPVNVTANTIKREACKKCREKGTRYDATQQHYPVGWIEGGLYRTKELGCKGCYMYDPIVFRSAFILKKEESQKEMEAY